MLQIFSLKEYTHKNLTINKIIALKKRVLKTLLMCYNLQEKRGESLGCFPSRCYGL
jgi:hypothetical protein